MSENNSTKKLRIGVNPDAKDKGKPWAYVQLLRGRIFQPSFRDVWRIVQAIAYCEDRRYPPPYEGRTRLARFLADAVHARTEDDFAALQAKYQIPERDGDRIVRTNGADVPLDVPPDSVRAISKTEDQAFVPPTAADIQW